MAKDTCLVKGNGLQKTANATVFLQEELGDARMHCDQLLRYLNEAVELINNSAKKDHFFEVAGHLIVELPKTAFKLQESLDAVALAANRIDYEEIKQNLPPEKTDRLEQAATTDVQVKQVTPGDAMTPKQAAAKLREIVQTARIEGSVPTRELAHLVGALDPGQARAKTASAEIPLEDRLEKLAAVLEAPVAGGKHSRTKLAAVIRGFMVEAELQAIQKQAFTPTDDSIGTLFDQIKGFAIVGARAAAVHRWRPALLNLYYIVDSIGTILVRLGSMDTTKSEGLKREIRQMLPQAAKTIEEGASVVMAGDKAACEGEDGKMGCGETLSKFEEGVSADPTENMSPEDAKSWKIEHLKNKDNFKEAGEGTWSETFEDNWALKVKTDEGEYIFTVRPFEGAGTTLYRLTVSTPNKRLLKYNRQLPDMKKMKAIGKAFAETLKAPSGGVDFTKEWSKMASEDKTAAELQCDMEKDCKEPITHIDNSGWVYCTKHGERRKAGGKPCRKLKPAELKKLEQGQTIKYASEETKEACAPLSAQDEAKRSRFEQNKPADPTQNMDPEDAMAWKEENAEHKNDFKDEKGAYDFTGM